MDLNIAILQVEQVTQSYVDWYSNKEVVLFSDNQYKTFSFEGQRLYVENCLKNKDLNLYGIFDSSFHIGNILISGLTSIHRKAELTYVVGNTKYWGRGVASFAISKMIEIGKSEYDLNKLCASITSNNIGSRRALEKNGFILEGTRGKHLIYNGEFFDQLDYGLII